MNIDILKLLASQFSGIPQLLVSAPSKHYKVYKIPKRTFGFRVIAQPTPEIKAIQRFIIGELSKYTSIHEAANAYVVGRNIVDNAKVHQSSSFLLKLDLENFFNSITPKMLFKALKNQDITFTESDKYILEQFLFWNKSRKQNGKLILSVGAPSSPLLSNIVMYSFDKKMSSLCEERGINYSRYADDLAFSINEKNILMPFIQDIKSLLSKEFGKKLVINNSKTVFSSKAHNRHITGVTITNDNKLSLGRDKKRYISSLIYKFREKKLDEDDISHLQGLLGLAYCIELSFITRLEKKYGKETIINIKRYRNEEGL